MKDRPTARHEQPRYKKKHPNKVIRIGRGGAAEGAAFSEAFWLSLAEAEALAAELAKAIRDARAATVHLHLPEAA